MVSLAINDKFETRYLKELIMTLFSYDSSNLSLLALENMRLLVPVHRVWLHKEDQVH